MGFIAFYTLIILGVLANKPSKIQRQPSLSNAEYIEMRLREGQLDWGGVEANFPEYARTHTNPYPETRRRSARPKRRWVEYPGYYSRSAGHWEEFVEDLDAMGIDPWDPDAEDYYNLNYGN